MADTPAEIVKVELQGDALAASATLDEVIRELIPEAQIKRARPEASAAAPLAAADGTVRERVLNYLNARLADDPHREELVSLATHHLDQLGHR